MARGRVMALRYPGSCRACGASLDKGTRAFWDPEGKAVYCLQHIPGSPPSGEGSQSPPAPTPPSPVHTYGTAGQSARKEFERRHEKLQKQIEQRWGRFAGVVKFLSEDPQSTIAWARGSLGEERLARGLLEGVGDRAILLHDLRVPGTRRNIDHVGIAPSGIWIIDAKNYKGLVERRDVGGWLRTDVRLYVGGRDRSTLAEGLMWQVDAVRKAAGAPGVPIKGALCFINAEWRLFSKPFQYNGAWVLWRKKLVELLVSPGPLEPQDATAIAQRVVAALPPFTA